MTRFTKTIYQSGETVTSKRAEERMVRDMDLVHKAIRTTPGIDGKRAITLATGLTLERVDSVIRRINSIDSGYVPVCYGKVRAHGEIRTGWFATNLKPHHPVMDQEDEHLANTEVGLRRTRLTKIALAYGLRGADHIVASMEQRLGVDVELLSAKDLEAFEALLRDEAAA